MRLVEATEYCLYTFALIYFDSVNYMCIFEVLLSFLRSNIRDMAFGTFVTFRGIGLHKEHKLSYSVEYSLWTER